MSELKAVSNPGPPSPPDRSWSASVRRRNEEDTAVVVALLAALSSGRPAAPADHPGFWGSPAFALRAVGPQTNTAWWASGLPR